MCSYREIEHTADWALRIHAENMTGLLINAAKGMLQLMGFQSDNTPGVVIRIELESLDRESLLVEWLQELLYLIESKRVGIGEMEIELENGNHMIALIEQIPNICPTKEIKAVTYHGLKINETENGLETTIVFDV